MFASVADNFKRKKPLDIAERVDLERWRQTEECKRDATNPMFCLTCRQMHYSSVATVEVYRLLLSASPSPTRRPCPAPHAAVRP